MSRMASSRVSDSKEVDILKGSAISYSEPPGPISLDRDHANHHCVSKAMMKLTTHIQRALVRNGLVSARMSAPFLL
jgi:hypothetical protein